MILPSNRLPVAVEWEAGKSLVIEQVEVAPPQAMEVAEGVRVYGAWRIIGVDLNANKFEGVYSYTLFVIFLCIVVAKKFRVTEFVNPKDHKRPVQDIIDPQVIAEMTNGEVNRRIECTGSIATMISSFECVHDGWGTVAVLVGIPNKGDTFKKHPMNILNERTLKGTLFGNYRPRSNILGAMET
ncbi:hypothetical protein GIB67_030991 [Kingdonia uniflora]|uniref:Alcohol dehydrogenase-like C-terminal domain-containing protein n=1 Tax=Kingdonia uniflora TaxID=39325 RepID=A0A7J7L3R4_9MAGN|nr:hypothetical protein GIB67_030991 [Kingdonia uniflora]